jgi:hypothetical protein
MRKMTYTRKTLRAERLASIERQIASLERKIQRLQSEAIEDRDPISGVFGSPEYRKGDGSRKNPLSPLAGTWLGEALKAAIALANEKGGAQWITFNEQVFYVNPDEDLKDVALRVEYVRKTLFPTDAELLANR